MARDMHRKRVWALAAAWLVIIGLAGSAMAQEQGTEQALARPDNAVVAESIKREMNNPAVLRLQELYAEAGVTTGQVERLRLMDARAFAMARFATREDIQEFHRERSTVLTSEQMKRISDVATEDFRTRLRGRTRLYQQTPVTSESLDGGVDDPDTSETFVKPDDETTPTLDIVPISSPDDDTSSAEKPASGDNLTTSSDAEIDGDASSQTAKSGDE